MKINETDNSYCPLIFNGLYLRRHSGNKKQVAPCCLADKSKNFIEVENLLEHPHLQEIRSYARTNKRHPACHACWEVESLGGESNRLLLVDRYKIENKAFPTDVNLKHLDYNTLPICNAKCIICSWEYSSLWAAEKGKKVITGVEYKEQHLDVLDLDNVETVYFNGGEPLLTNEHLNVLKQLKHLDQVELTYNTNGSCFPNNETLEIWNRAKSVTLYFSIDAVEENFETIRTPLKWDQVSENIKRMNAMSNINLGCSYTVGRHNIFDIEPTINWFSTLENFDVSSQFHVHMVSYGNPLSFDNVLPEEVDPFLLELEKFKDYYWYNQIKNAVIQ